jgi:hypothetical protein
MFMKPNMMSKISQDIDNLNESYYILEKHK